MQNPRWLKYKHLCIRDLAWLLLSPALFCQKLAAFQAFSFDSEEDAISQWLTQLDDAAEQNPSLIQSIDRSRFRRLGLYCEDLLHFYFQHGPHTNTHPHTNSTNNNRAYTSIIKGFRVQGPQRTIGECDFLVAKADKVFTHIELAVKFFLLTSEKSNGEWDSWVGPNAKDRLDLKLNRMLSHQLSLPHRKDTEEAFDALKKDSDNGGKIESRHLIKGMLFFPYKAFPYQTNVRQIPKHANPELLAGRWMRISEFLQYAKAHNPECILCEKMDWLTGPQDLAAAWQDVDSVIASIRDLYQRGQTERKTSPSIMLWIKHNESYTATIIVPDHWPETSSPSRSI